MNDLKVILRVPKGKSQFPHLLEPLHILSLNGSIAPILTPLEYLLNILHILIVPGHDVIIEILRISAASE